MPARHLARCMDLVFPTSFDDLFAVFRRLEQGAVAALMPPDQSGLSELSSAEIPSQGWLGVCSSGSTGRPKLIWKHWASLCSDILRSGHISGWTWSSPFYPYSFAGVQVALHAWMNHGRVLLLGSDWPQNWDRLNQSRPEALSCTPTFLDLLVQNERGSQLWSPRQITLGGEPLRAGVGDRFRRRFPTTRASVIYATAEHGVILKTNRLDGWYETWRLTERFTQWRVVEQALELRVEEAWKPTGDLVDISGDLLRIVGRADRVANVGGAKVSLDLIEEKAEQVAGIRQALATAEANSITGQIVSLHYEVAKGFDPSTVTSELQNRLRASLSKEAWPRRWNLTDLGLGANAKRLNQRMPAGDI